MIIDLGSEHTVGGKSYPMEMHLVHFKSSHATIVDALKEGAHDSLAVLGIFFEVSLLVFSVFINQIQIKKCVFRRLKSEIQR